MGGRMNNIILRQKLFESGIRQYEFAEMLNIAEATLSRWLRKELPEEVQKKMCQIVDADPGTRAGLIKDIQFTMRYKMHYNSLDLDKRAEWYANRIAREIERTEEKREKEREGWL